MSRVIHLDLSIGMLLLKWFFKRWWGWRGMMKCFHYNKICIHLLWLILRESWFLMLVVMILVLRMLIFVNLGWCVGGWEKKCFLLVFFIRLLELVLLNPLPVTSAIFSHWGIWWGSGNWVSFLKIHQWMNWWLVFFVVCCVCWCIIFWGRGGCADIYESVIDIFWLDDFWDFHWSFFVPLS